MKSPLQHIHIYKIKRQKRNFTGKTIHWCASVLLPPLPADKWEQYTFKTMFGCHVPYETHIAGATFFLPVRPHIPRAIYWYQLPGDKAQ